MAQPLNRLTEKGVTWQWSPAEQRAFDCLKGCLLEAPVLAYPDPALEYILDTNSSDQNVGAALSQVQEGREVVVAYYSKSLSPTEQKLLHYPQGIAGSNQVGEALQTLSIRQMVLAAFGPRLFDLVVHESRTV